MSSIFFPASAASPSASNGPECEPSHSARSTHTAAPSSPGTGPASPATTMSQLSLPLDLPQTELSKLWATPQARDHFPSHKPEYIAAKKAQGHGMRNLNDEVSMSSQAGSHAKTSPRRERAQALPALARDYGARTPELLAKYDRATSSWRTSQLCLDGELSEFSETWPRSGMTVSGTAYQLAPLVPHTGATGYGSLPTHSIPTPTASDHIERRSTSTETLNFATNKSVSLDRFAKMWPMPTSRDWKDGSAKACANVPTNGLLGRMVHTPRTTPRTARELDGVSPLGLGGLNPTWVEWLMGYKTGFTDLER